MGYFWNLLLLQGHKCKNFKQCNGAMVSRLNKNFGMARWYPASTKILEAKYLSYPQIYYSGYRLYKDLLNRPLPQTLATPNHSSQPAAASEEATL